MSAFPYAKSPTGRYVLKRDGKEVCQGSELECWQYLHSHHGYSVEHALRYEGYSMEPIPFSVPVVGGEPPP